MSYYNSDSNLLNSVGISEIKEILANPKKIDTIIGSLDTVEKIKQGETRGDLYIKFLAINKYISKKLEEYHMTRKRKIDNKEEIEHYIEKLYQKGQNNIFAFSASAELNKFQIGLDEEKYNEIKEKQQIVNTNIEILNRKYLSGQRLQEAAKVKLFGILQYLLDTNRLDEQLKEKYISHIINKSKINISLEEQRLFSSLIAEK